MEKNVALSPWPRQQLLPVLVRACKRTPSSTGAFLPVFFEPIAQPLSPFYDPASKDSIMHHILGFCHNDVR